MKSAICRMALLSALAAGCWPPARADMEILPAKNPAAARPEREKRWPPPGVDRPAMERGAWVERNEGERIIERLLANQEIITRLGLAEEQVNRMRAEIKDVQTRSIDLDAAIRKLALDQAERMSAFLQSPDAYTSALIKAADELGRARTEQAKLTIQRMVVIRKYLTPEQIARAHAIMREHIQRERGAEGGELRPNKGERRELRGDRPLEKPRTPDAPAPKPPEGW